MYLGIDIGGTFIKYGIVNDENEIIKKWKKPTLLKENKDDFYDYICNDLEDYEFEYIGVSAPGVIDINSNVLSKASETVQVMYRTNINKEIGKRVNKKVFTLNDAKSAGYCEFKIGNGRGTKSSAYFIIGTGIGGCICNEHGVIHGVNGIAGEFSPMLLDYKEGNIKFLAYVASMNALINMYNKKSNENLKYGIEVCENYLKKDKIATDVMNEWINNICIGLININLVYNPEIICIGGGISEEEWFINILKEKFNEMQFFFKDICTTRIEKCLFSNDSNILGAVLYAKEMREKLNENEVVIND